MHVLKALNDWMRRRAAIDELNRFGDDETAHIARDVGVSASELRTLAGKWPSSDLLSQRMLAVGGENVSTIEPTVLRDLQRVCTLCGDRSRCEHDVERNTRDRAWRDYCPNVATLDALRSEERDRRLRRNSRKWRSP
jgi:uncharacterized protein YjiS (DUF1127 family)